MNHNIDADGRVYLDLDLIFLLFLFSLLILFFLHLALMIYVQDFYLKEFKRWAFEFQDSLKNDNESHEALITFNILS